MNFGSRKIGFQGVNAADERSERRADAATERATLGAPHLTEFEGCRDVPITGRSPHVRHEHSGDVLAFDLHEQYWRALERTPGASLERRWCKDRKDVDDVSWPVSALDCELLSNLSSVNVLELFDDVVVQAQVLPSATEILELFAHVGRSHVKELAKSTAGVTDLLRQGYLAPALDAPLLADLPVRR